MDCKSFLGVEFDFFENSTDTRMLFQTIGSVTSILRAHKENKKQLSGSLVYCVTEQRVSNPKPMVENEIRIEIWIFYFEILFSGYRWLTQ